MKSYPTTSIIISTYNWPQALEVALLSIANQTILPTEVIIADDGSKKETTDLIEKMKKTLPYPVVHVWHEDNGFRLAAIRNKAIAIASGEYIIQIDGDVILEKHFIKDHLTFARPGCFVSGSRVTLSSQLSKKVLEKKQVNIPLYTNGVGNHLNGLRSKRLRDRYRFTYRTDDPYYVKGCNMAFWKKDLFAVNGYNEDMTGWGREDSEVAARLIALDIRRQFIKFGGVLFHIDHPFNSREREDINYDIFQNTVATKSTFAKNGLDKYL